MRRLLKFLLCWSPSLHVPHFFDWHTYVKRPNLQWRPSHKSLWHLSIGAAAVSAVLVLLLLWTGIHAQPTAINSPDAKPAQADDLAGELPDDPFGKKTRVADPGDDPFAAPINDDQMLATAKPKPHEAADPFDSDFAPPIRVSQDVAGPKISPTEAEPSIVMDPNPTEEPSEPETEPLLPTEEPKIVFDENPIETPAEPELDPTPEPKIVMEAPQEEPAEPDLEPIMPEPEPKIVLDEKPEELPAEPEEDPVPPAKSIEVALAPMPEIEKPEGEKPEPVDEEPPAPPFKVVQVAQANRPSPFGGDDDEEGLSRKPAPKPAAQKQPIQPRKNPMDDEAFDDTPPKKAIVPSAPPNRPRPSFGSDEDNDPMPMPKPTATKTPAPIPKPIDLPPEQPVRNNPMNNNPMGDDDGFPMSRPAGNNAGGTPAAKPNSNIKIRDLDDQLPSAPPAKVAPAKPKASQAARPNPFGDDEDPMGAPRTPNPIKPPTKPVVQSEEFPDPAQAPMPQPPQNAPMPQQRPRPSSQVYDEAVSPQNDQMKPRPELRIEILSAPEAVVGGPVVLSFRIANIGRIPATGVLAIDALPPELRHPNSQRLEYRIGRLNPGESRSTQLRLTAAQAGLTINRASVSSDEGGFAEGSVKINVLDRGNRPNYQPNPPPGNCEPVPYQYILTPQPDCCVPY
jgi:uncharacterized repeat protein (TIGR01451 family)